MMQSLKQRVLLYNSQKRHFFKSRAKGIPIYGAYFFSGKTKLFYTIVSISTVLFFSIFFYRSFSAVFILWPVGVYLYLVSQKKKGEKRKQKLEAEFKDCILFVAANLRAGYSVENAFLECIQDMHSLYGADGLMGKELLRIKKGLHNNIPLETLLCEFGSRSCNGNIREFGEVFSIARVSGGSLPEIIQSSAGLIGDKIALKQEIQAAVSGRLFEQKIMHIMPFALICYIEAGNKGFFDVLYHNFTGTAIMTGCLFVYVMAYFLSEKICVSIL